VTPPPAAVIITVADPSAAVLDAVNVTTLDSASGKARSADTKLAVTPAGSPDAEKITAELNPFEGVTVRRTRPVAAAWTLTADNVAASVKLGGGETVMVRNAL
jgi:hypothetical protein